MPKFPPSLAKLLDKVESRLPELVRYGRGNDREMRADFQQNITTILLYLLRKMDISSGRCVQKIAPDQYCTVTVKNISHKTNLSVRTVNRVLSLLTTLGLLEVTKQKLRRIGDCLLATAAIRRITDKFFMIYGMLSAIKHDRTYQETHNRFINIKCCVAKIFFAGKRSHIVNQLHLYQLE